jgi:uncharacterized SAM-binding protein YcdF (DUF218 family)
MIVRKPRWGLSWRGWLVLVVSGASSAAFLLWNLQPFLAETHRITADVLVVEGWVHEYTIRGAVNEFRNGSYHRVFTTGNPAVGNGGYVNDYQTSASVGAGLLQKNGLGSDLVQMVPSHVLDRDRTFASAVALREWFREHNMCVRSLNVVTEGAHARRTRLMFQEAFGKDVAVGVVAVANPDFDEKYWWRYSEGVKQISSEALAYLYARLFFRPSEPQAPENPRQIWQAGR